MSNFTNQKLSGNGNLLNSIFAIRQSVRDALSDQELTQLLHHRELPSESGFGFLSFEEQFVTLSVPPQRLEDCYPDEGWITRHKERIAREIAVRHEFLFSQPPDSTPNQFLTPNDSATLHHHIEFSNRWETVVIAHPYYVRVRPTSMRTSMLHLRDVERPLKFHSDLLMDLSDLFHARRLDSEATMIGLSVVPDEGPSRQAFLQPYYSFQTSTGI